MQHRSTILVADDEIMITEFVAEMLRDEGYDVQCVYDGEGALQIFQAQSPDMAILDNMMPRMSGLEVLQALRAQGFQQPIIMMSAAGREQSFMSSGASAFLPKPFSLDALLQVVTLHLR